MGRTQTEDVATKPSLMIQTLVEDVAIVGTVQLLHLELQHLVVPRLVAINEREVWPLMESPSWPKPTVSRAAAAWLGQEDRRLGMNGSTLYTLTKINAWTSYLCWLNF